MAYNRGKQEMEIIFNDYTQTFRLMPQNYWLASIKDGKLLFDSWDGMAKVILQDDEIKDRISEMFQKINKNKNTQS